jgi:hypothetical protein
MVNIWCQNHSSERKNSSASGAKPLDPDWDVNPSSGFSRTLLARCRFSQTTKVIDSILQSDVRHAMWAYKSWAIYFTQIWFVRQTYEINRSDSSAWTLTPAKPGTHFTNKWKPESSMPVIVIELRLPRGYLKENVQLLWLSLLSYNENYLFDIFDKM